MERPIKKDFKTGKMITDQLYDQERYIDALNDYIDFLHPNTDNTR